VPPSAQPQQDAIPLDGRRERGARNKAAVVQALLQLYEAGEIQPSAARIAEIAGVSERSVFRYFDDMEDLAATAIVIQWERIHQFYEGLDGSGDFEQRLDAMIEHRLRLFDKTIGVGRASAVVSARSATVASAMNQRRTILRDQAIECFGVADHLFFIPGSSRIEQAFKLSHGVEQLRREAAERGPQVVDVALEHRQRCVVAGGVDRLRQVDDHRAVG
jgi:AcrR family transcriptional regulator